MFKVLILAAQDNVNDERMEFLIRDRLSCLRFLGFGLGDRTPDENQVKLPPENQECFAFPDLRRPSNPFFTHLRVSYSIMGIWTHLARSWTLD
jgi:hypothetical protein